MLLTCALRALLTTSLLLVNMTSINAVLQVLNQEDANIHGFMPYLTSDAAADFFFPRLREVFPLWSEGKLTLLFVCNQSRNRYVYYYY